MRTIDKDYVLEMKDSAGTKKPAYYKYCTVPAGSSDIASLLYRTGNREMGEIPLDTEVPEHYREHKVLDSTAPRLWLYDADGKSLALSNDAGFEIYIAGRMGLLIRFKER